MLELALYDAGTNFRRMKEINVKVKRLYCINLPLRHITLPFIIFYFSLFIVLFLLYFYFIFYVVALAYNFVFIRFCYTFTTLQ
jgi:hypothetical protein